MVSYRRVLAVYVHDLNPVVVKFTETVMIRWYGVAYLLAFFIGFLLLRWLGDRKLWVLPGNKAGDFISLCALAGVFLGGRLGYVLFYLIPDRGFATVANDPAIVLRVWDGGMSSHGGILGIAVVTWFYARRHKISWPGLGDGICVVAPLGLLFGRIANFINGELFGRETHSVSWAVKFPQALMNADVVEGERFFAAAQAATVADPSLVPSFVAMQEPGGGWIEQRHFFEEMLAAGRANPAVNEAIAPFLEARHPSQLYEGMLEGALLFAILWILRVRFPRLPHGMLTGAFFALYAVFRIFVEEYRMPDSDLLFGITKGQFLSLFMLAAGAGFIIEALVRARREKPAASAAG